MDDTDRLWRLMADHPTCMMITHSQEDGLHARPMTAIFERERNRILFYTHLSSGKSTELAHDGDVMLSFADPEVSEFVSVTGTAALTTDPDLIQAHWSSFVVAWFPDGATGADVAMIVVTPARGEYWDGPSSQIVSAIKMLVASATDSAPDMGDHAAVDLSRPAPAAARESTS